MGIERGTWVITVYIQNKNAQMANRECYLQYWVRTAADEVAKPTAHNWPVVLVNAFLLTDVLSG